MTDTFDPNKYLEEEFNPDTYLQDVPESPEISRGTPLSESIPALYDEFKNTDKVEATKAAIRGAGQGPLPFGDEIVASANTAKEEPSKALKTLLNNYLAIKTLGGSGKLGIGEDLKPTYYKNKEEEEKNIAKAAEDYPKSFVAGQLGTDVLAGAAIGATAPELPIAAIGANLAGIGAHAIGSAPKMEDIPNQLAEEYSNPLSLAASMLPVVPKAVSSIGKGTSALGSKIKNTVSGRLFTKGLQGENLFGSEVAQASNKALEDAAIQNAQRAKIIQEEAGSGMETAIKNAPDEPTVNINSTLNALENNSPIPVSDQTPAIKDTETLQKVIGRAREEGTYTPYPEGQDVLTSLEKRIPKEEYEHVTSLLENDPSAGIIALFNTAEKNGRLSPSQANSIRTELNELLKNETLSGNKAIVDATRAKEEITDILKEKLPEFKKEIEKYHNSQEMFRHLNVNANDIPTVAKSTPTIRSAVEEKQLQKIRNLLHRFTTSKSSSVAPSDIAAKNAVHGFLGNLNEVSPEEAFKASNEINKIKDTRLLIKALNAPMKGDTNVVLDPTTLVASKVANRFKIESASHSAGLALNKLSKLPPAKLIEMGKTAAQYGQRGVNLAKTLNEMTGGTQTKANALSFAISQDPGNRELLRKINPELEKTEEDNTGITPVEE